MNDQGDCSIAGQIQKPSTSYCEQFWQTIDTEYRKCILAGAGSCKLSTLPHHDECNASVYPDDGLLICR